MSKFFSSKYASLVPYTPGEQPRDMQYIKLNTNESPFPPSPKAMAAAAEAAKGLQLYSDPTAQKLNEAMAAKYGVSTDEIIMTNGSDEVLNFAFMAFCDETHPAVFADITYGFYSVFADINRIPSTVIPLREDFTLSIDDYIAAKGTVFIANPNAPTGLLLPLSEIERLLQSDPSRMVIIDEAYIDFGGKSCVPLIHKYDNLLVTGTFSKSRSMAGARLGFGVANKELIRDLNTIKYSTNPYNVNSMTMASGIGCLSDEDYTRENCEKIISARAYTMQALREMGFTVTDSRANFVFARHPAIAGEELYLKLRQKGILVRHFTSPKIADYNRITIGTMEQMQVFVQTVKEILK
ncbi:MAG: histidinol-phosphate transaminase [Ruminococcaceae bacterium]|nr:histidinol-phosphate transaminase [Oscillospiraceae bacterium]